MSLTINTPPSVVVCQPVQLTWSGGQGPYFLSILPGNQPGAAALVDFGRQEDNTETWLANLAAGTSIFLQVRDSQGAVGQSGTISIQTGSDTSCVGQNPSTSAGTASTTAGSTPAPGTTGSPSSTTPGATTAPGSSTTGSGTTSRSTTGTGTGTSAPAASSSKPAGNSAIKTRSAGILALVGVAVVAALL